MLILDDRYRWMEIKSKLHVRHRERKATEYRLQRVTDTVSSLCPFIQQTSTNQMNHHHHHHHSINQAPFHTPEVANCDVSDYSAHSECLLYRCIINKSLSPSMSSSLSHHLLRQPCVSAAAGTASVSNQAATSTSTTTVHRKEACRGR